jgi:hypothetical protein
MDRGERFASTLARKDTLRQVSDVHTANATKANSNSGNFHKVAGLVGGKMCGPKASAKHTGCP